MIQIQKLIAEFDALLIEFSKEIENAWQVSVANQFRKKDDKFFNNQDKLRNSGGRNSLSGDLSFNGKVDIRNGEIQLSWETEKPYAGIQNRGGFIRATPTQDKYGNKTYKMAQYFWYLHGKESVGRRKEIYKMMALSVEKRGGVKIKPKNYLENSLKDFEQQRLNKIVQNFFNNVARIWNAN